MASDGNLLSDKAVEQVNKTVREVSRRMMNLPQERARWHFHGGSGGGNQSIEFTVISLDCETDPWTLTVEVTWFSGGCTAAIPGEDSYGYVEVQNRCNIAEYFTSDNIIGLTGTATYRYPRTGDCEPAWRLDDICGEGLCPT